MGRGGKRMALRGFGGLQTVPSTPVPCFGTTLSAAPVINPDQYTGQITPGSNRSTSVLSVAAGTAGRFRTNDRVALGTAAQFEQGNVTAADGGTVIAVSTANNTITIQGLQRQHVSGEFVILALPVAAFAIQWVSGTAYIGEDATVSASSSTLIQELTTGAPTCEYGQSNIANVLEVQHLWIGGVGATYIPSLLTV